MPPDCKELVEGVELSHVLVELGHGHCCRLVASGTHCCASVTMFAGDPISNQMVHHNYQRHDISWAAFTYWPKDARSEDTEAARREDYGMLAILFISQPRLARNSLRRNPEYDGGECQ